MPIQAAQLVAKVTADTAQAETGLGGVTKLLGGALPLAAGAGALAVVGIGLAATKMAGDFQANMTTLVTGAGESEQNIGKVSQGILQMARDTGTSTDQLTAGMFMIESAGHHGADGLNVLKVAAQGAKVGNADLGVTADALTTILADYPNVTNGAAGAMNTLTATVASGKTHMQDLATAMSSILPTASAAKVGLNDVMGAMATMTGEGVPAANAATYLRQTILALDAPGKQAQNTLKSIGLSSKQVSDEMQVSLPATLQMITDHLKKKFPEGSAAYVQALKDIAGGSKTMQGLLDLTGEHMQSFKDNTAGVTAAVKQGGTSVTGWALVQNDFNTKMDRAKQVVSTLMIELGTHLLPVAGQVADIFSQRVVPAIVLVFTTTARVVTGISNFIGWLQKGGVAADTAKVLILILAGAFAGMAASAIPAAVTAITASVVAFGAQTVAAGAAAIATLAAALPFILVGAAIAAVIGIIILLVTHWKDLMSWFNKLGFIIEAKAAFIGFGQMVGQVASAIGGAFKAGINDIIGAINVFIHAIDSIQIHIPSVGVGPAHTPSFDWNGVGIPTIPLLAEGGDVWEGGDAIVGDAGAERLSVRNGRARVTPLPGGRASVASSSEPIIIPVHLYMDGRKVTEIVVQHIPNVVRHATGGRGI